MYSLHELFCSKKKRFLQLTVLYLNVTTKNVLFDHYSNIFKIIFEIYQKKFYQTMEIDRAIGLLKPVSSGTLNIRLRRMLTTTWIVCLIASVPAVSIQNLFCYLIKKELLNVSLK